MYPDFWQRMLQYTDQMEDICSFVQVSRYFYRLTNMDFQKLCYRNMICRFKGETWATAFSNKYKGSLTSVQLINRSTQLLLDMKTSYIVYDLINKSIVKVYSALPEERYYCFTLYYSDGTLVDLLNQKEYKVNAINMPQGVKIGNADLFDYRKYLGFLNPQHEYVLIHNETGNMEIIFSHYLPWEYEDIWLLDAMDHVQIINICDSRVYGINTRKCIFIETNGLPSNIGFYGLQFHNFHGQVTKFAGYNKKTREYAIISPEINYSLSIAAYCPSNIYPLPMMTIYRMYYTKSVLTAHLDWSTGKMIKKYFNTDNDLDKTKMARFYLSFCDIKIPER
ncbi:unnamed protein product [Bursaphelenchus okinawaensis]|uniref:Uncharacterized protein n=1 Tax=Bursaphelenchus okinawaensis TaxID=465554 RepID=A0A811L952_9BILA|nr:unnamed protein product [Bursaphelenchus okinawaensis]CAG9119713.1 unnamed protein product [Bursaphelenchus okinawaensis]